MTASNTLERELRCIRAIFQLGKPRHGAVAVHIVKHGFRFGVAQCSVGDPGAWFSERLHQVEFWALSTSKNKAQGVVSWAPHNQGPALLDPLLEKCLLAQSPRNPGARLGPELLSASPKSCTQRGIPQGRETPVTPVSTPPLCQVHRGPVPMAGHPQ